MLCKFCGSDRIETIRCGRSAFCSCPECGSRYPKKEQDSAPTKSNICCQCANACGGCSWSRYDPASEKILFQPVPGWTAEPCVVNGHDTYHITCCPQFKTDGNRYVKRREKKK